MVNGWLVGGLEHEWFIFHFIKRDVIPTPLTSCPSFFRGRSVNRQRIRWFQTWIFPSIFPSSPGPDARIRSKAWCVAVYPLTKTLRPLTRRYTSYAEELVAESHPARSFEKRMVNNLALGMTEKYQQKHGTWYLWYIFIHIYWYIYIYIYIYTDTPSVNSCRNEHSISLDNCHKQIHF